jgi:hypothetical protein
VSPNVATLLPFPHLALATPSFPASLERGHLLKHGLGFGHRSESGYRPPRVRAWIYNHERAQGPICFSFWPPEAAATCQTSSFLASFCKNRFVKTVQNQREHTIDRIVVIVGMHHFLDTKLYKLLYLPLHVIHMIFRFSLQLDSPHNQILKKAGQKKNMKQIDRKCAATRECDLCHHASERGSTTTRASVITIGEFIQI